MASPAQRAPVRVSKLLAIALPGLEQHLLVERIREQWAGVVGPDGARRSRPESLRQGVLTVAVDSSPWLHELTLRSGELLARVQASHGGAVTALRFALGRLPSAPDPRRARPAPARQALRLGHEDRREIEEMTAAIADPALAATLERLLTKDRLARGAREAPRDRPGQRRDA
jgi:hypothetical protein